MAWKRYGTTNEPETCLWCGDRLRPDYVTETVSFKVEKAKCPECGVVKHANQIGEIFCPDCDRWISSRRKKILSRKPGSRLSGSYHDGLFCGLRCGYQFGLALAKGGRRLKRFGSDQ